MTDFRIEGLEIDELDWKWNKLEEKEDAKKENQVEKVKGEEGEGDEKDQDTAVETGKEDQKQGTILSSKQEFAFKLTLMMAQSKMKTLPPPRRSRMMRLRRRMGFRSNKKRTRTRPMTRSPTCRSTAAFWARARKPPLKTK